MTADRTAPYFEDGDWLHLWQSGRTPWHNQSVHDLLTEYWDKLHPTDDFTHIYVPLCGKTVDMRWLYEKGVNVVGNDLAEEAAVEFVKEHPQLAMSRTEVTLKNGEQTVVYETPDKRLKIYVCKFESMLFTGEKFDMVWDRAAFVALDPSMRQTFVDSTFELLRPDFRWLQETLENPPSEPGIPPHSASDSELRNLFEILRSNLFSDMPRSSSPPKSGARETEGRASHAPQAAPRGTPTRPPTPSPSARNAFTNRRPRSQLNLCCFLV